MLVSLAYRETKPHMSFFTLLLSHKFKYHTRLVSFERVCVCISVFGIFRRLRRLMFADVLIFYSHTNSVSYSHRQIQCLFDFHTHTHTHETNTYTKTDIVDNPHITNSFIAKLAKFCGFWHWKKPPAFPP